MKSAVKYDFVTFELNKRTRISTFTQSSWKILLVLSLPCCSHLFWLHSFLKRSKLATSALCMKWDPLNSTIPFCFQCGAKVASFFGSTFSLILSTLTLSVHLFFPSLLPLYVVWIHSLLSKLCLLIQRLWKSLIPQPAIYAYVKQGKEYSSDQTRYPHSM